MNIDINYNLVDSGEDYKITEENDVFDFVTSVTLPPAKSIEKSNAMEKLVNHAIEKGISIGAYLEFPSRIFNNPKSCSTTAQEVRNYILFQLGVLNAFVKVAGLKLQHVKVSNELYALTSKDFEIAKSIVKAINDFDSSLIFMGLFNTDIFEYAQKIGLVTKKQFHVCREYNEDGVVLLNDDNNLIKNNTQVWEKRLIHAIETGKINSINNKPIDIVFDTVCIEGKPNQAMKLAKKINESLEKKGIMLQPLKKYWKSNNYVRLT